jgi:O-antigen ligase
MWKTALRDWRSHPVLGIGFLPEVPSYVQPWAPNTGNYESFHAPPVSGPHNSYLSVLARMGLVGSGLFLWLMVVLLRQAIALAREHPHAIPELLLLFIPLNGAVHAFFNVGFESPHRCMILWLVSGMLMIREKSSRA